MQVKLLKNSKSFEQVKKYGNKSLEVAGRFGNQKHFAVMRDAFAMLTPLIIAGALAVLLRAFVFGGAGALETSILGWIANSQGNVNFVPDPDVAGKINWVLVAGTAAAQASHIGNFLFYAVSHATIDFISIYASFGIGYFLARVRNSDTPVIAGVISLSSFLVSVTASTDLLDADGLFAAIIVSIVSTEIFCLLAKQGRLILKMPAGVPPAVARAFGKLLPAIIILFGTVLINLPFILIGEFTNVTPISGGDTGLWNLGSAIYQGFQSPFQGFVGSTSGGLGVALVYVIAASILWFFGIHGTNVLFGIFSPIYLALYSANVAGTANAIFVAGTFDAFVFPGGIGATWGFIIAVYIFSRNKGEREIVKLATGPAIFQINEPIIFGVPMVLNVRYIIPFILSTPILTITTQLGFTWFGINRIKVYIPWTSPFGIGALLATSFDWKAFILALINFIIAFAVWFPWIIFWTRKEFKHVKRTKWGKIIDEGSPAPQMVEAEKGDE